MDERIVQLERQLQDEEARREQAEARRQEAEARQQEAEARQQEAEARRQEAEARAAIIAQSTSQKDLYEYIQACHELSLAVEVVTDRTLTTQGNTTNPAGRLYPQRIIPSLDFVKQQERTWELLSTSLAFVSKKAFPSSHQLDYVRTLLNPISDELGLRNFARDTVENAVRKLIDEVYEDTQLQERLNIRGTITFESHTNLGQSMSDSVDDTMQGPSMEEFSASGGDTERGDNQKKAKRQKLAKPTSLKPAQRTRDKGGRADQFCIYRLANGQSVPVVVIEYKAPHKITREEVLAGLNGEIVPADDIINKEGDSFEFLSKSLMAAVITQCFSYMVYRGIQYGYIFTGEVCIFLTIPEDPKVVYYYVCIPNLDAEEDSESGLHRTAVAQIFAFVLRALAVEPPPQSWHDATAGLDSWAVEYIDILKKIPETVRRERDLSAYRPTRWKDFIRSPIRTRSRCMPADPIGSEAKDDSDSEDDGVAPTPTPNRLIRSRRGQDTSKPTQGTGSGSGSRRRRAGGQNEGVAPRPRIEERPYCTHQCLLGLLNDWPLDTQCPNVKDHKAKHINRETFVNLIRSQLATDRGPAADCRPLYIQGRRGALFKLQLSSHGYTLIAKGVTESNLAHLDRENRIYNHISSLQGSFVPVCLGALDLKLPYYYNGGVYVRMLFLSWAGRPLFHYINGDSKALLQSKTIQALQALHDLRVLHQDAEMRNILYDVLQDRLMLVDFDRAQLRIREPLKSASPNLKRKRESNKAVASDDCFDLEIQHATACISRYMK